MAFGKLKAAGLKAGKTVPLVLNMLPGEPVIHVEHLGDENASYINDAIAKANAKAAASTKGKSLTVARLLEIREKNRDTIAKHCVRRLEAVHDDGRAAVDSDIPEFVQSLPGDVIDTIVAFANDAENFRERPIVGVPSELAEK